MIESIFTQATEVATTTNALLMIVFAFVTGIIISLTYIKTYPGKRHSHNFALTMVLLPAVISMIIMLIGSDIAKAFSLAGAFSIIRFRSAPGEPKDIAFVLFAMAAGLANGVGAFGYALLFTLALCLVMYLLSHTKFGMSAAKPKRLSITVPEDLDFTEAFDEVLERFTERSELIKVKSSALGSLFQLTYEIEMKKEANAREFIDELRVRNSNLNITLTLVEDQE